MRPGLFGLIFASASCVFTATPAHAIICYVIYDRNENVIYQSTYPPVDMSNAGAPERDALRRRGEHMTFGEIDQCKTVVFLTGVGGASDVKVDEVVAGMPVPTLGAGKRSSTSVTRTPAAAAHAPAPKAHPGTY
jgi:hypothetical protein